ncbi:MAG: hypothetical protein OXI88_01435 [Gammaproteobacteria bacterium]|nr:hypothetical protein [Gammaproteobacteria bacterium]MDE0510437.1 hypothetical protein [Gammaproteobacteria bacterium]
MPDTEDGGAVFPRKDAAALECALDSLGVLVRYNLRAQKAEMSRRGSGRWREMNDRITADLRRDIAERFQYETARGPSPLHYGAEQWTLWLNALLHPREVDPFKKWLEVLGEWDKTFRLNEWFSDVFTIRDGNTELTQWAARFVFYGAVTRTMNPGCKLDEMPVLIGPQGIGKSTALRLALPPDMPELFNDGLHLAADPKFRAEALQGRVIVEASEMSGVTRAELESLKAFLSRTDDGGVRLAYRRNPEAMPRRCIIAGTSNNPECLPNDPSGNRRFVPVYLDGGDPAHLAEYLDENRNHLWAEAMALYAWHQEEPDEAPTAWLPRRLKGEQEAAAEQARRKDEILEDAIDRSLAAWGDSPVVMSDLIKEANMEGQRNIDRRAAAYLQNLGYRNVRRDGRRVWLKN